MKRYRPPEEGHQDAAHFSSYDSPPSQAYNSRSPPTTQRDRAFHFEPAYSQPPPQHQHKQPQQHQQHPQQQHQQQQHPQQQQYVNFHPVAPGGGGGSEPPEKKQKPNNYFEWKQDGPVKVNPSSESKRVKERERRKIISDSITQLRNAIPVNFNGDKLNQVNTMTLAIKYIKYLQNRVAELEGSTDLSQQHLLSNYSFNPEEDGVHFPNPSDHANRSNPNNDSQGSNNSEPLDRSSQHNGYEIKVDPSNDSNEQQNSSKNNFDNNPNNNYNKQRNNKGSFAPAAATLTELTDSTNIPPFVNDSNTFYQTPQQINNQTGVSTAKFLRQPPIQDSPSQDETSNYSHPTAQELVSETSEQDTVTKRRAPRRLPIIGETDVLKKPDAGESTPQDSNIEKSSKDNLIQHS